MVAVEKAPFSYERFCELVGPQLYGSRVPEALWQRVYQKLAGQVLDAGNAFQIALLQNDDDEEEKEEGEKNGNEGEDNKPSGEAPQEEGEGEEAGGEDAAPSQGTRVLVPLADMVAGKDVWVIDHAWTFRVREARQQLTDNADLRRRVRDLVNAGADDVDAVYRALWPRASHYRIATDRQMDEESVWYLMDEVGSALAVTTDADAVNCAVSPVFFPPTGCAFTLLWITKDVEEGTLLQIAPPPHAMPVIDALLYDRDSVDADDLIQALTLFEDGVAASVVNPPAAATAATNKENKDEGVAAAQPIPPAVDFSNLQRRLRVVTDVPEVADFVRIDPTYELVEGPAADADAAALSSVDIAWITEFSTAGDNGAAAALMQRATTFISQFGSEVQFCNKGNLAQLVRRTMGFVPWLPRTYSAATELHLFAADYCRREQQQLQQNENGKKDSDNLWIVKPTSMARSMDMVVTDQLPLLLRIGETGPKIISKYISRPLTFQRRKFDLRLIVACRGLVGPSAEAFLFERVWPRFALEDYGLEGFDVYEKHWTVMNYANPERMIHRVHTEFVEQLDAEYGPGTWDKCFASIKTMIRQLFTAIAADPMVRDSTEATAMVFEQQQKQQQQQQQQDQSSEKVVPTVARGSIFGIDAMLTEDFEARLLEVTFSPDCIRAHRQYPHFYNSVFTTLLTGQPTHFERVL